MVVPVFDEKWDHFTFSFKTSSDKGSTTPSSETSSSISCDGNESDVSIPKKYTDPDLPGKAIAD